LGKEVIFFFLGGDASSRFEGSGFKGGTMIEVYLIILDKCSLSFLLPNLPKRSAGISLLTLPILS
jgi:hypothetical protein